MKLLKIFFFLLLILLFAWVPASLVAQDDEEAPDVPVAKLIITDTNVEAIPTVGLRLVWS